jgi:hypothetical protein
MERCGCGVRQVGARCHCGKARAVVKNNWTMSVTDGILVRSGRLTDDVLLCDSRVRLRSSLGTNRPESLPNVFRV